MEQADTIKNPEEIMLELAGEYKFLPDQEFYRAASITHIVGVVDFEAGVFLINGTKNSVVIVEDPYTNYPQTPKIKASFLSLPGINTTQHSTGYYMKGGRDAYYSVAFKDLLKINGRIYLDVASDVYGSNTQCWYIAFEGEIPCKLLVGDKNNALLGIIANKLLSTQPTSWISEIDVPLRPLKHPSGDPIFVFRKHTGSNSGSEKINYKIKAEQLDFFLEDKKISLSLQEKIALAAHIFIYNPSIEVVSSKGGFRVTRESLLKDFDYLFKN